MRFGWVIVTLALLLGLAGPVNAQSLPADSPWTIQYDDDSCALRRVFRDGDHRGYLELRRFGPGLSLQAVVASNKMQARSHDNLRYRFDGQDDWAEDRGVATLTLADDFSGVLFLPTLVPLPDLDDLVDPLERQARLEKLDVRAMELSAAAAVQSLSVRGVFRRELLLQTGPLDQAITALNTCVDELQTHWGIDVEAHRTLTRQAFPVNLRQVPRMMDYPPKMVQRSMPGLVNVRLAVDETGKITGCHIQMPLSDPEFEASSCADLQHALDFDPALDKDGKPIASYWITRVVFSLD